MASSLITTTIKPTAREGNTDEVELSTFLNNDSLDTQDLETDNKDAQNESCRCLPGPPWVINILANELCERFSYYGLRAILPLYFVSLGWTENESISVFMFESDA